MDSEFSVDGVKMWWKQEGGSMEKYLKPFRNDEDASMLSLFAEKNEYEVEIYIKFEDNEEERMHDFDEDFGEGVDEGMDEVDNGRDDVDGAAHIQQTFISFLTPEMEKEYVIEENYMTGELDSGADEDNCDDTLVLIRFNEEEPMTKEFTFKVGMKFSSLKKFKKDILEYKVFNGREVIFSKSDASM
ncbi:unnamed protein product [Vicia faba]|uniref:Uncharacterized protein n=1 Tax=Vicia faba TaxID=3906 RepID=A0AAV1AND2_VICFA|nr:unnamed protein product [Vicia faba]